MHRFISKCFLSAAILATTAFGQGRPGDRAWGDRAWGDAPRQDHALFDHVRMDLDRAGNYPYASKSDRKRFDEARRELFDFESRFDQGRYEKHELNEAIDRLQRVVEKNSLDPRDRGALADDLRRMRDFREFRNHPGAAYGYR